MTILTVTCSLSYGMEKDTYLGLLEQAKKGNFTPAENYLQQNQQIAITDPDQVLAGFINWS
jgi:hypothetical protein